MERKTPPTTGICAKLHTSTCGHDGGTDARGGDVGHYPQEGGGEGPDAVPSPPTTTPASAPAVAATTTTLPGIVRRGVGALLVEEAEEGAEMIPRQGRGDGIVR